jgi:hypothetical protein
MKKNSGQDINSDLKEETRSGVSIQTSSEVTTKEKVERIKTEES